MSPKIYRVTVFVIIFALFLSMMPATGLFNTPQKRYQIQHISQSGADTTTRDGTVSPTLQLTPEMESTIRSKLTSTFPGFIQNAGQSTEKDLKFYYSTQNSYIGFYQGYILIKQNVDKIERIDSSGTQQSPKSLEFSLSFVNSKMPQPQGEGKMSSSTNFISGQFQASKVSSFNEIWYYNLYNHIDLKFYMTASGLKYEFIVHPGGNPQDIQIQASDNVKLEVQRDSIQFQAINPLAGFVSDRNLFTYTSDSIQGTNHIDSSYVLNLNDDHSYGFNIGNYDTTKNLVIDPLLGEFATYLGGTGDDIPYDIEVDNYGDVYVFVDTYSSSFPTTAGAYLETAPAAYSTLIMKLSSVYSETRLFWSTYITTSLGDGNLAVDTFGNVYFGGSTGSVQFTHTSAYQKTYGGGAKDMYIGELKNDGTQLIAGTYLGGSGADYFADLKLDKNNNVYITGFTTATNFPTTAGALQQSSSGSNDIVVAKLDSNLDTLVYGTYVGGTADDYGEAMVLDSVGNAYVTGYSTSTDFPTVNAYDSYSHGNNDPVYFKLNQDGSALEISSYFGAPFNQYATSIALDNLGNIIIGGYTSNSITTTPNAYDSTWNGLYDGFVAKFNSTGNGLIFSTMIGGSGSDFIQDLTVDDLGNVYFGGVTDDSTTDYPTANAIYGGSTHSGLQDGFLSVLSADGSDLIFSRFLGTSATDNLHGFARDNNGTVYAAFSSNYPFFGNWGLDVVVSFTQLPSFETKLSGTGYDSAWDLAMDSTGNIYVTGNTVSTNFPTSSGIYDTSSNGGNDVFVTKLNETGDIVWSTYLGGSGADLGYGIAIDTSGIYLTGSTASTDFPTTSGVYQTSHSGSPYEGFITKMTLDGTALTYSTFIDMEGQHIVIDGSGYAYVVGDTFSDLTATSNAVQTSFGGGSQDAAVAKLNTDGTAVVFATYLGGAGNEFSESIAVDSDSNVYVTGSTLSTDFPTSNALNSSNNGGSDIFLTKLNSTGTGYNFSTYLGGSGDDAGLDLMVNSTTAMIYLVGSTTDDVTDLGTTSDAYNSTLGGGMDAFIMKVSVTPKVTYASFFGGSGNDLPYGMAMDNVGNLYIAGYTSSSDLPMTGIGRYSTASTSSDGFVAKFNSTNSLVMSSYLYNSTGNDYINAIEVDGYGRIAVAGDTATASQDGWVIFSFINDNVLPTISAPDEYMVPALTTYVSVDAIFSDENPATYDEYLDGVFLIGDVTWQSNVVQTCAMGYIGEGNHTLTLVVYDQSGNFERKDIIIVKDTTNVAISNPADVVIKPNLIGNSVSWTLTDLYPNFYNITVDGVLTVINVPWTNGVYSHSIDGLSVGSHVIQISASDQAGWITTNTVNVYIDGVVPDISQPSDILMGQGDSQTISWSVGDVNPGTYVIRKNGTSIASGTWANGTIPYDLGTLQNGLYNISLEILDKAGNAVSDYAFVEVDGEGPFVDVGSSPIIYKLDQYPDFSFVLGDKHLSGIYNVTMNGNLYVSDTTWAANGTYIVSISGLAEGTYTFVIYAYDIFGNVNSATKIIKIDNTPPDVTSPSDLSYAPGATGQSLSWVVGDISPGMYNITLDGVIYVSNTSWTNGTITHDFSDQSVGTHTVVINVWDSFGHTTSDTVIVIVDNNVPVVNSPNDTGYYPGTTGNLLSWQVGDKDPERYEVWLSNYDGSGTPQLLYSDNTWSNGTLTFNIDGLPVGEYFLHIILWDVLGNWSEDFVRVSVDDIAPTVSQPNDMIYASDLATEPFSGFSWDVSDSNPGYYNITVDGVLQAENLQWVNGSILWNVEYPYGIHSVVLTLVDLSGNFVTDEVIITWDNASPIVSSPDDFSYVEGSTGHVVTWTVSDLTGYTVRLYDNGNMVNEFQATVNDSYTLGADDWTAGTTNELRIEVVDLAGHTVTDSVIITVTAESTPSPTSSSSSPSSSSQRLPTSTTSSEDKGGKNKKSFISYNPILIFNILGLALLGKFRTNRKQKDHKN